MRAKSSFGFVYKHGCCELSSLAEPDRLPNRLRGERVWSNSHQRFVSPSQQISKLYGQMIECCGMLRYTIFVRVEKTKTKTKKQLQEDMDQIVNECARALKDKQIEAISSFVQGHDTFVSLPTGYGKSMIYALLPSV